MYVRSFILIFVATMCVSSLIGDDHKTLDAQTRTNLVQRVVQRDLERKLTTQFNMVPTAASECSTWKNDTQALIDDLQASGATVSARQFQEQLDCQCLSSTGSCNACDVVIMQSDIDASGSLTINNAGTYCLGQSVTSNDTAVIINTNGVTLDLQGHRISGGNVGVMLSAGVTEIVIRHGVIENMQQEGVSGTGTNITLQGLDFVNNNKHIVFSDTDCLTVFNTLFRGNKNDPVTTIDTAIDITNSCAVSFKCCKIMFNRIGSDNLIKIDTCQNILFDCVEVVSNRMASTSPVEGAVSSCLLLFDARDIRIVNSLFSDNSNFVGTLPMIMINIARTTTAVEITKTAFSDNNDSVGTAFFTLIFSDPVTDNIMIRDSLFVRNRSNTGALNCILLQSPRSAITHNIFLANRAGINVTIADVTVINEGKALFVGNSISHSARDGNLLCGIAAQSTSVNSLACSVIENFIQCDPSSSTRAIVLEGGDGRVEGIIERNTIMGDLGVPMGKGIVLGISSFHNVVIDNRVYGFDTGFEAFSSLSQFFGNSAAFNGTNYGNGIDLVVSPDECTGRWANVASDGAPGCLEILNSKLEELSEKIEDCCQHNR